MKETLCWSCKNATGKCPWSHDHEEVEGWEAEPTITELLHDMPVESFVVSKCPMYKEDYKRISINKLMKLAEWGSKYTRVAPEVGFAKFAQILAGKGYDLLMFTEGRDYPEFYIKRFATEGEEEQEK